ncbi:MAG TPA: hypothetical protein VJN50_06740 [Actinomycetota bacterium]|nr:hypothetical protein [Actinomycetota bacterium]
MTARTRMPGPAATAGAALGGVTLAHCLAYLAALPAEAERHSHMTATGHGSFPMLVAVASAAAGAALLAVSLRALGPAAALGVVPTAARLAAIQVPGFALLELIERRMGVGSALADPAVRVGLVLQVLVALGAALLLRGVERTVGAVARRRRRDGRAVLALPRRGSTISLAPRATLLAAAPRRAPPLPLATT